MRNLYIIILLIMSSKLNAQDYIQTTSIRVNDYFQFEIQGMNVVYDYDDGKVSIQLYQAERDEDDTEHGVRSVIRINNFYLPYTLGIQNTFKIVDLVNGGLPEIILTSDDDCQAYCGTKTFIINLFLESAFKITDFGLDNEIISNKGEITYSESYEDPPVEKVFKYNYVKKPNEFFVREFSYFMPTEDDCAYLIRSILYDEIKGYSKGVIKWKVEVWCPACFTGDMLISLNESEKKPISSLKVGDQVLTYDFEKGINKIARIEGFIKVPHNVYVEYHFDHDSIIATLDHPFYLSTKGWSSLDPKGSVSRYNNYKVVNKIAVGDTFKLSNGKEVSLKSFTVFEEKIPSYTITKLSEGNSFYINDILVGVEDFEQHRQKIK